MAKTFALIFILGLMVSCASHQNDRAISSIENSETQHRYFERPSVIK